MEQKLQNKIEIAQLLAKIIIWIHWIIIYFSLAFHSKEKYLKHLQ